MEAAAIASGALGDPGESRTDGSPAHQLFRKLSWLTLFRLLTVTILLGGTAVSEMHGAAPAQDPSPLYVLIASTYAVSLGFALALRARWRLTAVAYTQIALDVSLAAVVVSLTGFSASVFVFLFSIAIVNGSILLFRRGAFVGSLLSLVTYLPLALLGTPRAGALSLFVHCSAFVATAALAGYLAEQLRRTGERLAVREDDLAAMTALHESIVQSVTSGIITIDRQERITFLNGAAEEMTGLRNDEVRGEPAQRWFSAFEQGTSRGETDLTSSTGRVLRVGYTSFPLVSGGARPMGSAIIFQDLTSVRAMEQEMKQSERLADLGRLAAGLAHELRNPLASMSGSIELLRGSEGLTHEDAHLMEIVLREAERLEELLSRLLTFTRPDAPRCEDVDLFALAKDTLEVFANDPVAARVRVESRLSPVQARCDADQIRQVLWNLLRNGAEAASARENGGGVVSLRLDSDAGAASLVVEDNGAGIEAADLPNLFTPFYTTKTTGTGLGLATVHRIAEAHGGTVRVETCSGGGARFSVTLPLASGAN